MHKDMTNKSDAKIDPDRAMVYQIRLQGGLSVQWAAWFDGLAITICENGDTLLTGTVADQAALYSLLRKVRDLSMPLLSVIYVGSDPSTSSVAKT